MDKTNETTHRVDAQVDIIVLGVVSTDTHGPGVTGEGNGTPIGVGITRE